MPRRCTGYNVGPHAIPTRSRIAGFKIVRTMPTARSCITSKRDCALFSAPTAIAVAKAS